MSAPLYRAIADAFMQLAEQAERDAGQHPGGYPPLAPLPADDRPFSNPIPSGVAEACPVHGTAFMAGKFGPYCPNPSKDPGDPRITDKRGYCNMNPQRAAAYR